MSSGVVGIFNGLVTSQQAIDAIMGGAGVTVDDSIVVTERVQNAIRSFENPDEEKGLTKEQIVALQKKRIKAELKFSKQIAAGCLLISVPAVPIIAGLFSISPIVAGGLSILGGGIFVYEGMPESNHRIKEAAKSVANRTRKLFGYPQKDYGPDEEDHDLGLGVAKGLLHHFPALGKKIDAIESKPLRWLAKTVALPYTALAYPYKKLDESLKTQQVRDKAYSILDFNVVLLSEIILSALIHSGAQGLMPLMALGAIGAGAAVTLVMTAGHIIAPLDNWGKILETKTNAVANATGKALNKAIVPVINFMLKNAGTALLLSIGTHMILGPLAPALTAGIEGAGAFAPYLETALHIAETGIGGIFAGYALGAALNGAHVGIAKTYNGVKSLFGGGKPAGDTGSKAAPSAPAPNAKPGILIVPSPDMKEKPPLKSDFDQKKDGTTQPKQAPGEQNPPSIPPPTLS